MRLHLIIFGVVVQVVQPLVRQTAYEECVGLAPRTFSRDLKEQLCGGVTVGNFPQSSAAVECANAVAKARALSPELTVELCAAGGNAAGKAGGECAAEAYKRLKMSNVPAALRMQLCLSAAPLANPAAPSECAAAAGKRLQHLQWLSSVANNGASHRVSLCRGAPAATPTAPVDCVAALPAKHGGGAPFLKTARASVQAALQLCARAPHEGPGLCAAAAAKVLPLSRRPSLPEHFVELCADAPSPYAYHAVDNYFRRAGDGNGTTPIGSRSKKEGEHEQHRESVDTAGGEAVVRYDPSLSTGSVSCLRSAPSDWSLGDRLRLCGGGARDHTPAKCVSSVKGRAKWSTEQLLALCHHRAFASDGVGPSHGSALGTAGAVVDQERNSMEHASACANAAPTILSIDEKVVLCEYPMGAPRSSALQAAIRKFKMAAPRAVEVPTGPGESATTSSSAASSAASSGSGPGHGNGTVIAASAHGVNHGVPGPAACARAARSLPSTDRVLLCRGAWSAAPASCFSAAPFTMEKALKLSLCRGSPIDSSPGRCAAVVRSVQARQAALMPHPALSRSILDDTLAVELCLGSPSLAPAQCFDAAPDFLVEISSTLTTSGLGNAAPSVTDAASRSSAAPTMTASLSLRAALCADADDIGPAECAHAAANFTPAVLSPATVVSLCHGKRRSFLVSSATQRSERHRHIGHVEPPQTAPGKEMLSGVNRLPGSIACALAAEAGMGLSRRLHLDPHLVDTPHSSSSSSSLASTSSLGAAPVNLLRLCSSAKGTGPAKCVAMAPSKLSVEQKIQLCKDDDDDEEEEEDDDDDDDDDEGREKLVASKEEWGNDGDITGTRKEEQAKEKPIFGYSSEKGRDLVDASPVKETAKNKTFDKHVKKERGRGMSRDPTMPAQCAMAAASFDVPPHKVVAACRGAVSTTPAHCLREAPSLSEEDILRCRDARSIPSEVHLEKATWRRSPLLSSPSPPSPPSSDVNSGAAVVRSSEGLNVQASNVGPNGDVVGKGLWSDEFILDALVVDQFHQPVDIEEEISVEVIANQPSSAAADSSRQDQIDSSSDLASPSSLSSGRTHEQNVLRHHIGLADGMEAQKARVTTTTTTTTTTTSRSRRRKIPVVKRVGGGVSNGTVNGKVRFSAIRFLMGFLGDDRSDSGGKIDSQEEHREVVVDDYGFELDEVEDGDAFYGHDDEDEASGNEDAFDESISRTSADGLLTRFSQEQWHHHQRQGGGESRDQATLLRFSVGDSVLGTVKVLIAASSLPFRAGKDWSRSMREKAQQQHREVASRLQQESRQRMVEAQEKRVAEGVARRSSRHVSNAFSSLSLALHPSPWVDNLIGFLASSIALALVALILRSLSPQRAKRRSRVAFRHQSDDSEEEGDSDESGYDVPEYAYYDLVGYGFGFYRKKRSGVRTVKAASRAQRLEHRAAEAESHDRALFGEGVAITKRRKKFALGVRK